MAGVDLTVVGKALKDIWKDDVHVEIYKESALLGLMTKNTKFNARSMYIDVVYAGNRARSATYANAKANGSAAQNVAFQITRKKNYAFGSIDRETLLAAEQGNTAALYDALGMETRTMVEAFKQDMSADAYSDGSGVRGQLDSTTTLGGTTLKLRDPNTVVHFEVNDIIVLSANSDGTSIRTGTLTVTGVDRDAGTLTVGANINSGITSPTANDYIYKQGDAASKPVGIGGWIPASAPSVSENFFGIDRSKDATRLAGIRYDASSNNHEEALQKGLARGARDSCYPRDIFMHPDDVTALALLLGSKKEYEDVEVGSFGFTALKVNGPKGTCRVFSDPWAVKGYAFALSLDFWTMHSLGVAPDWVMEDGAKLSRQSSADAFDFYLAAYYQFACEAPGQNIRIKLAAV